MRGATTHLINRKASVRASRLFLKTGLARTLALPEKHL